MSIIQIAAMLITLCALFGWINVKFLKLPNAIGMLIITLAASIIIMIIDRMTSDIQITETIHNTVSNIDFFDTVMNGMLSFLLFASALHIDLRSLSSQKIPILILASFGVVLSTFITGGMLYYSTGYIGYQIPLIWCFVFGALISPTDPVAVLSVLKTTKIPKTLEAKIAGESLFNDGVGVIMFTIMLAIALASSGELNTEIKEFFDPDGTINAIYIGEVFIVEIFGALALGIITGFISIFMMKNIDDITTETTISIATVMITFVIASKFHMSAPIAVVIAGLIIGSFGSDIAMSERTKEHLFPFWSMTDEILNSILFLLIGLEVMIMKFAENHIAISLIAIPVIIIARYISVGIPILSLKKIGLDISESAVRIMTWGGVRGGISVALALSIPDNPYKAAILSITYACVIFSIIVQGLTIKPLVNKIIK